MVVMHVLVLALSPRPIVRSVSNDCKTVSHRHQKRGPTRSTYSAHSFYSTRLPVRPKRATVARSEAALVVVASARCRLPPRRPRVPGRRAGRASRSYRFLLAAWALRFRLLHLRQRYYVAPSLSSWTSLIRVARRGRGGRCFALYNGRKVFPVRRNSVSLASV